MPVHAIRLGLLWVVLAYSPTTPPATITVPRWMQPGCLATWRGECLTPTATVVPTPGAQP